MTSHELAKKLLNLPDLEVCIVIPQGEEYTQDLSVYGSPWRDLLGCIRIQATDGGGEFVDFNAKPTGGGE